MQGEIEIIHGIQALFASPAGKGFVVFCSRWLIYVFALLAAGTSLYRRREWKHAAYEAGWSALLALVAALALGELIGRIRPFQADGSIGLLIPAPLSAYSFPSAHTAVAFAIASALAYAHASFGFIAFAVAFLVAFGRVGAGVHYPSDVIAGALVGFLAFVAVRYLHKAIRRRDVKRAAEHQTSPQS